MSILPPKIWWHDPSLKPLDQHPIAHFLGGIGLFLLAAINMWVLGHYNIGTWCVVTASEGQLVWEIAQTEFTPGYSFWKSGVYDWLTATLAAWGFWAFLNLLARLIINV